MWFGQYMPVSHITDSNSIRKLESERAVLRLAQDAKYYLERDGEVGRFGLFFLWMESWEGWSLRFLGSIGGGGGGAVGRCRLGVVLLAGLLEEEVVAVAFLNSKPWSTFKLQTLINSTSDLSPYLGTDHEHKPYMWSKPYFEDWPQSLEGDVQIFKSQI